jgi:hypothetical protein
MMGPVNFANFMVRYCGRTMDAIFRPFEPGKVTENICGSRFFSKASCRRYDVSPLKKQNLTTNFLRARQCDLIRFGGRIDRSPTCDNMLRVDRS